jgi:hypothetical protein
VYVSVSDVMIEHIGRAFERKREAQYMYMVPFRLRSKVESAYIHAYSYLHWDPKHTVVLVCVAHAQMLVMKCQCAIAWHDHA